MNPAQKVMIAIKIPGIAVHKAYFLQFIRMSIVVQIIRAHAANNWLLIPNKGQILLIFPVYTKYPHEKVNTRLVITMPGIQFLSLNLGITAPNIS